MDPRFGGMVIHCVRCADLRKRVSDGSPSMSWRIRPAHTSVEFTSKRVALRDWEDG